MNKVIGSLAGREEKWMMDGGLCGRTKGGTFRSPEVTGTAVAAVHLPSSLLSPHFYWQKSFCCGTDTLALSTSVRLPLRVCSKFHYDVSKWQVFPQLTVLPMTCAGHCRITQEKQHPCLIYGACWVSLVLLACACVSPAFLKSAQTHALDINISLNDRYVKLIHRCPWSMKDTQWYRWRRLCAVICSKLVWSIVFRQFSVTLELCACSGAAFAAVLERGRTDC